MLLRLRLPRMLLLRLAAMPLLLRLPAMPLLLRLPRMPLLLRLPRMPVLLLLRRPLEHSKMLILALPETDLWPQHKLRAPLMQLKK